MQNRGVGGGSSLNLKPPDQLDAELQDRRVNPQSDQQAQKCPRCGSLNTKFCYYNNYSLSQPRYLCKTCRRYWTKGGTLRNVPVGGGCRKGSKRPKRSVSDTPGNPSTLHQAMAESAVFSPPQFGAIRSQFLVNQSSSIGVTGATDAKISETNPPFSSLLRHPQYINHALTLGDYSATFGSGYHASPLANATQQDPLLPNSDGFRNEIEQWREVSTVDHGSLDNDGSLHLLPRFETTTIAGGEEASAAASAPSLVKPEPLPANFDGNGNASSADVCYWNNQNSGTSLVGENWPEFSGYTPDNSFL